jgi:hypothetical protein
MLCLSKKLVTTLTLASCLVGCDSSSPPPPPAPAAESAATTADAAVLATAETGVPRLPNGKPDLNGIWARPYVADMGAAGNGRNQTGPGQLPFTEAGRENFANYNPSTGDYTGSCLPFGLLRSMNSPDPIQFMQTDTHFAFLYEQNSWFKVINLDGQNHSTGVATWFGHTIAAWEGDTLVLTTAEFNGKTRLDTIGHPHSDQLVVTERLTRRDATTLDYAVTINDPIYYSEPWSNQRVFTLQSDFEIIEYSCEENNKSVLEGRILPPNYDDWHTSDKTAAAAAAATPAQ